MNKASIIFAVALGGVISLPAGALEVKHFEVATTRDLIVLCSAPPDHGLHHEGRAFCYGYLDGVLDYHAALTAGPGFKPIACYEPTVTRDEVRDVFVSWAEDQGDVLDNEAPTHGVMRAVVAKWPCPGN
ncbi:MAG: Rap1a/Tai family immunity protein [Chromatiales bacterium]